MIPISVFLILFLVFIAIVVLFTFFNVYHMMRFGKVGLATLSVTTLYILVVGALMLWTIAQIFTVDWALMVTVLPSTNAPLLF